MDTSKDTPLDLEFWMTRLPQNIRKMPLVHLAIPGSHDSMTYAITGKSKIAPDAEAPLRHLRFLGRILTGIMARWGKTQDLNAIEQLLNGVRYFDLRVATKKKSDNFYFVHGLYGNEVFEVFTEIRKFLDTHPKEVVILDCQHFYAFQEQDHQRFMKRVTSFFGHRLLPWEYYMGNISLESMTNNHHQVVIIYRSDYAHEGQPNLWPSPAFPTPWADTMSVPVLISFLNEKLRQRDVNLGFVSQCILTASLKGILMRLWGNVKSTCFRPLQQAKYQWLNEQRSKKGRVNIIISDFVGYDDGVFAKTVIGLNNGTIEGGNVALTPIDGGD